MKKEAIPKSVMRFYWKYNCRIYSPNYIMMSNHDAILLKHAVGQNGRKYREMAISAGNFGTSHDRAKNEIMRATNFADIISFIHAQEHKGTSP